MHVAFLHDPTDDPCEKWVSTFGRVARGGCGRRLDWKEARRAAIVIFPIVLCSNATAGDSRECEVSKGGGDITKVVCVS